MSFRLDLLNILWQVYLPAIEGHIPHEMVQTMQALLEFCYIARRNVFDTESLKQMDNALSRFCHYRKIFETSGIVSGIISIP